jgi:hypothetical protein
MYFWNSRALAQDLQRGELSQRERVKYLLATLLVLVLPTRAELWSGVQASPANLLAQTIVAITATILGIYLCFSANDRGDGKEFTDRFVCLGWTTGVRVATAFLAVELLIEYLTRAGRPGVRHFYFEHATVLRLVVLGVFEIVFYWRLRNRILLVSQAGNRRDTY